MSARADAAIIRAQERLRVAADLARRSYIEARAAERELLGVRDPLAAWMIEGIQSVLDDFVLEDAAHFLLDDCGPLPEARARMRRMKAEMNRKPSEAEVRAARAAA